MMMLLLFFAMAQQPIPDPYYLDLTYQDQTLDGLRKVVGEGVPHQYINGSFDCSNMASYMQWKLKSLGFDAKLCLSLKYHHTWVAVDLNGTRYFVEATAKVPYVRGPGEKNYYRFSDFDGIYDSLYRVYSTEFIWWNDIDYSTEVEKLTGYCSG